MSLSRSSLANHSAPWRDGVKHRRNFRGYRPRGSWNPMFCRWDTIPQPFQTIKTVKYALAIGTSSEFSFFHAFTAFHCTYCATARSTVYLSRVAQKPYIFQTPYRCNRSKVKWNSFPQNIQKIHDILKTQLQFLCNAKYSMLIIAQSVTAISAVQLMQLSP